MEPMWIDGQRSAPASAESFAATDPSTGESLADRYPIATRADLRAMLAAAKRAAQALRAVPAASRAAFLEAFANEIEADADAIAALAARETALPLRPRLREIELGRTLTQLRQAAAATREGAWALPTTDAANNLHSRFTPLGGAVLVFGPNNFPLAFNAISGGDFAAAIAAGNPVIAKGHPAHPGTTARLAAAAQRALGKCPDLPPALVQMFFHCGVEDGLWLVGAPEVAAVAFTGSRGSGMKLKAAADHAGKPVYLEMSSVNPVFVLPGALAAGGAKVVEDLATSMLQGAGQFCTSPGLVILPGGGDAEQAIAALAARLQAAPAGVLLSSAGPSNLSAAVATLCAHKAQVVTGGAPLPGPAFRFANTLLRVTAARFVAAPVALQTEAFGTAALVVVAADADEMVAVAEHLEGSLTACVYSGAGDVDEALYRRLAPVLVEKAGRLLNDKMPTGVALSPAMVHGGPYPATGHPGFTAVGVPASIRRFAKLTCFDNVRPSRLPS